MSRTWLITGSSRGFGLELTRAVLATARRPEQLTDLLAGFGDRGRAAALGVADPVAARAAVQAAVDAFGALDVVVNNAGYANSAAIEEMDGDELSAQIEANFFEVMNVKRSALPVLRGQHSGTFVQFSVVGAAAPASFLTSPRVDGTLPERRIGKQQVHVPSRRLPLSIVSHRQQRQ